MKYNTWGTVVGIKGDGELFIYFHPNDVNISKFAYALCTNKVLINGKKKENVQMQCFHVTCTFCLYFFIFLIIAFETYNNMVPKTKALFIHEKV